MKETGLRSKYNRKKRPKARTSGEESKYASNVLQRGFQAEKPGEKWVTDIKYIEAKEEWSYLCMVLDLFNREVLDWSLENHMEDSLVVGALKQAIKRRKLADNSLIHSERASQYTSKHYQDWLKVFGVACSMIRKGNCSDNAVMESFFGTLEQELLKDVLCEGNEDLRVMLFEYIEIYYNRQRIHSTLGYQTPLEVSQQNHEILPFTLSG